MLSVKYSEHVGCTFLGKGLEGHPEMGVIVAAKAVVFDEWDCFSQTWKNKEVGRVMYFTDNGYAFDDSLLEEGVYKIELYAPNWRAHKGTPWSDML